MKQIKIPIGKIIIGSLLIGSAIIGLSSTNIISNTQIEEFPNKIIISLEANDISNIVYRNDTLFTKVITSNTIDGITVNVDLIIDFDIFDKDLAARKWYKTEGFAKRNMYAIKTACFLIISQYENDEIINNTSGFVEALTSKLKDINPDGARVSIVTINKIIIEKYIINSNESLTITKW